MGKDKNGQMWIAGFDGSVYRFDPAKNTFLALNNGRLLNDGYLTNGGEVLSSTNYFYRMAQQYIRCLIQQRYLQVIYYCGQR